MIGLGWLVYVRAGYRDSTNNESHLFGVLDPRLLQEVGDLVISSNYSAPSIGAKP